jgi:hypothetical protein
VRGRRLRDEGGRQCEEGKLQAGTEAAAHGGEYRMRAVWELSLRDDRLEDGVDYDERSGRL